MLLDWHTRKAVRASGRRSNQVCWRPKSLPRQREITAPKVCAFILSCSANDLVQRGPIGSQISAASYQPVCSAASRASCYEQNGSLVELCWTAGSCTRMNRLFVLLHSRRRPEKCWLVSRCIAWLPATAGGTSLPSE